MTISRPDIRELLSERILVIDGSMGALIMSENPDEAFYRGERLKNHPIDVKNATDLLVLTQPQMIYQLSLQQSLPCCHVHKYSQHLEVQQFSNQPVAGSIIVKHIKSKIVPSLALIV